ncbi:MAG: TetR/AcrR family transcriptional regulator [Rhizobiaceae bacterium]
MPREKQYNKAEVVERAMNAFWAHGYEKTSVNDLVNTTGLNRGSLYSAFDDKRKLFIESLRSYDKRYRSEFLEDIAGRNEPVDAIIALFEEAALNTGDKGKPAGCLLVNTALEVSPHDEEIRDLVQTSLNQVEEFFLQMIEKAKSTGVLSVSLPERQTSKSLLGLFLGLRVLTRSGAEKETLDTLTSQARVMLGI